MNITGPLNAKGPQQRPFFIWGHIRDPDAELGPAAARPDPINLPQAKFFWAKSQLTSLSRKVSTNLGRKLR